MKPYPCIEATLEIQRGPRLVRLWIDRDEVGRLEESILVDVKLEAQVYDLLGTAFSPRDVIDGCIKLIPRLNAVQVCLLSHGGKSRKGIMVYTVPFAEKEESRG